MDVEGIKGIGSRKVLPWASDDSLCNENKHGIGIKEAVTDLRDEQFFDTELSKCKYDLHWYKMILLCWFSAALPVS